jgi:hypothetical protein
LLCRYKDIVTRPDRVMRDIYAFIGCDYPGDQIVSDIHSRSVSLGRELAINPEIEALCQAMWQRFEDVASVKNPQTG